MQEKSLQKEAMILDYGDFSKALLSYSRVCFICHHNADPDSFLSAYALLRLREEKKSAPSIILAPAGVSKITRILYSNIGCSAKIENSPDVIRNCDCACLVDISTLEQIPEDVRISLLENPEIDLLMIDHHEPHPETTSYTKLALLDPEAKATAILVYNLFKETRTKILPDVADSLLAAILYDTRRLMNADPRTFRIIADLIEKGGRYKSIISWLSKKVSLSERIAKLKAAMRMQLYEIDIKNSRLLIALSNVSSYEASAARALIDLGADLAIVIGVKKGRIRICSRATSKFYEVTEIHLGKDLMMPLGKQLEGAGGGHTLAASANGKGDLNLAIKHVLKILKEKVKVQLKTLR